MTRAAAPAELEIPEAALPLETEKPLNRSDPENLEALFDAHHRSPEQKPDPPPPAMSSLESFVADFKKRAHDWRKT